MSTEVDSQQYLYQSTTYEPQSVSDEEQVDAIKLAHRRELQALLEEDEDPEDDKTRDLSIAADENQSPPKIKDPQLDTSVPFKHNPLHDLESVLWVALFVLLCSTYVQDRSISEAEWQRYRDAHRELAKKLFCNQVYRYLAMSSPKRLLQDLDSLHPRIGEIARKLVINFGQVLVTRYRRIEEDLPEDGVRFSHASDLYSHFVTTFVDIAKSLKGNKDLKIAVHCVTAQRDLVQHSLEQQVEKRPRSSDSEEAELSRSSKAPKLTDAAVASSSKIG